MGMMNWMLVVAILAAVVVGVVFYYRRRQKALFQGFEQIAATIKQVPAQKKQGFLLLMFRESAKAGKKTDVNPLSKMNDPKYLEVQLLQMNTILKDRSKVKDKKLKQALQMYDAYVMWEKQKATKARGVA